MKIKNLLPGTTFSGVVGEKPFTLKRVSHVKPIPEYEWSLYNNSRLLWKLETVEGQDFYAWNTIPNLVSLPQSPERKPRVWTLPDDLSLACMGDEVVGYGPIVNMGIFRGSFYFQFSDRGTYQRLINGLTLESVELLHFDRTPFDGRDITMSDKFGYPLYSDPQLGPDPDETRLAFPYFFTGEYNANLAEYADQRICRAPARGARAQSQWDRLRFDGDDDRLRHPNDPKAKFISTVDSYAAMISLYTETSELEEEYRKTIEGQHD